MHDIGQALTSKHSVPGIVNFSFDANLPAPSFNTINGIDATAVTAQQSDGSVAMVSGTLGFERMSERQITARVIDALKSDLRVWVHETCYQFPVSKKVVSALQVLYLDTDSFNKLAPNAFKAKD